MNERIAPVKIHIKERPQDFGRFKAAWTPTLIAAEADGTGRHRYVGFLLADDFLAQLELGLAKAAFSRGGYSDAQRAFERAWPTVIRRPRLRPKLFTGRR